LGKSRRQTQTARRRSGTTCNSDPRRRSFWEKSYEGATMADLIEAMGINRSGMYAAFGDKESLFHRVMERHLGEPMDYVRQALAQPSLREVVAGLILGTTEFLSIRGNPRGCLLIHGALASGTDTQPIKQAMIDWKKSGEAAPATGAV
jgi:AcrR family transcriptional regulator